MKQRKTIAASEFRLKGRDERFVGANGDINAANQKDLLKTLAAALNQLSTGDERVVTDKKLAETASLAKQRQEMVLAAFEDADRHRELGEALAADLTISTNKAGFARQFLKRQDLAQGQEAKVMLQMKNVIALVASGPTRTETQPVRDNWFYPPEFYITTRPFVEQRDINRATSDILEVKYIEAMEGIMVAEDKCYLNLARASVGIANEATTTVGTLSPTALSNIRNQVSRWRIPATSLLMASDLWTDIIGDSGFQQLIDPVAKHELFLEGALGRIIGMNVYTDAYRHQTHHVLNKGEMWVIGSPETHGQYTDRGGVVSSPIDHTTDNVPGRGWAMNEVVSMVIANARSIAYAKRV